VQFRPMLVACGSVPVIPKICSSDITRTKRLLGAGITGLLVRQYTSDESAQGVRAKATCFSVKYSCVRLDAHRRKRSSALCQNCVTCPVKPRGNTAIYGDMPTRID